MTTTSVLLEDTILRLIPFKIKDDIDKVIDLVMKCPYTRLTREEARIALLKYETIAWHGHDKATGELLGIVYLTKTEMGWTLDAYKDDAFVKTIDNTMDYSFRAGKLVSDYAFAFTDTLLTAHAFSNRGATIVCKKLGFKEDFIILKKEKAHGS